MPGRGPARRCSPARRLALACAFGAVLGIGIGDADAGLESRVMVLPIEGSAPASLEGLTEDLTGAVSRGARRTTQSVAQAAASLGDTAALVGCDPSERDCLDSVTAALNVDQMLIVQVRTTGDAAEVEVTAVTRDAEPVAKTFVVRPASRKADLAAIERSVPELLDAGEARVRAKQQVPPPPPPPPAPTEPVDQPTPIGPYVVAGAGGVIVLAGAVFWGLAYSQQSDIDAAPTSTVDDLERLRDLEDRAARNALIGNGLVIGGAVVVAAGATWWFLGRRQRDVVVAPTASSGGGAGLIVEGRW